MPSSLKHARVTFTGKLISLTRKEAFQLVRDAGGEPTLGVSRRTSIVVVGMEGWPLLPDGEISSKLKHAEELRRKGQNIEIISEDAFLELAGLQGHRSTLRKTYPAQEVCRLLKLSPETLRRWEQFSLVHSENGLYDFQDLVSLRTIGELVSHGVNPTSIAKSLKGLSSILPDTERPLAQLKVVADNPKAILVNLGECLMAPNGQLTINFDAGPRHEGAVIPLSLESATSSEWFEYGQTCEDEERYAEAEEAYRKAIALTPHFPEVYFNLGNVKRVQGHTEAAEELYRAAVSQDPELACAWYNLADLQEEAGRLKEAVASFQRALEAFPSYADAHFNLALCYEKLSQKQDANRHWSVYLKLDPSSQWAEIAKRHLSRLSR